MSKRGGRRGRAVETGSRVHWHDDDIHNLILEVRKHWTEFSGGIQRKKYIWNNIAAKLKHDNFAVTGEDCNRKWRNLKIRYIAVLKKRMSGAKAGYRIDYFADIHSFLKDDPDTLAQLEMKPKEIIQKKEVKLLNEDDEFADATADGQMGWTDRSIELLLDVMLEFKDWFSDKDIQQEDSTIWETISEQMKMEGHQPEPDDCRQKWYSLALVFQRHKAEVDATGILPLWPYYTRVREVMKYVNFPKPGEEVAQTPKESKEAVPSYPQKKKPRKIKQEIQEVIEPELIDDPLRVEESEPSTSSRAPTSVKYTDVSSRSLDLNEVQEVCQRLERLEETVAIYQRIDRLESRLDDATQQQDAQNHTNSLLNKVLSELTRLNRSLNRHYQNHTTVQDTADLASGITIVVPRSQQLD